MKPRRGRAPVAEVMNRAFSDKQSLVIEQTTRGCVQECFGCEARSEFRLKTKESDQQWGYSREESSCLARLCCSGQVTCPLHPLACAQASAP